MNEQPGGQERGGARFVVELFGSDANGRKMIAWGRRIGCRDAGHGFEPGRGVPLVPLIPIVRPLADRHGAPFAKGSRGATCCPIVLSSCCRSAVLLGRPPTFPARLDGRTSGQQD